MKKFLIVVLCAFVLLPLIASAQVKKEGEAKEPATKLEAFLAKKGKLIVKDFYKLEEVAGRYGSKIEFEALVIYEPGQESQGFGDLKSRLPRVGDTNVQIHRFSTSKKLKAYPKQLNICLVYQQNGGA